MNKRTNKELLPVRIIIAVAIVAIFAASLWMYFGQETVAMQSAREAYAQFLSENPESQDKDFIYIYEDSIIIAIRNGKVVRKEYTTEVDAVKAALSSKDGANYSLSGTDNGKLFAVKLFEKTDDIYALGLSTLAVGADKLSIKVVTNGMIFATFEIPAEAIDRKESPVGITVKKINPEDNVTLGKNETGFAYDIDVTNLVENNKALIHVTMNAPCGLVSDNRDGAITAYHKDKIITATYDAVTGQISFSTTHFSPYTFTWEEIEVNNIADLRYYLQLSARVNIKLGDNFDKWDGAEDNAITIDLTKEGIRDGINEAVVNNTPNGTNNAKNWGYDTTRQENVYYSSGYYTDESGDKTWLYFGAIVLGEKSLDMNGKTIVYKSNPVKDTKNKKADSALFAVGDNSSFTIRDSKDAGIVAIKNNQYAVWAVNDSSTVNILSGTFMADGYATADANATKALIYSSGGEIHVRGGYFLYDNYNEVDFVDENGNYVDLDGKAIAQDAATVKVGKTNGGFNVLDEILVPRIWIYEGVCLSNPEFRQSSGVYGTVGKDDDSIMLIGGATCSTTATEGKAVTTFSSTLTTVKSWYTVKGQALQVKESLNEDKYIYRVGNGNTFKLGAFFEQIGDLPKVGDSEKEVDISVRVVDIIKTRETIDGLKTSAGFGTNGYYSSIDVTPVATYQYSAVDGDWANSTIIFNNGNNYFTGPVRLELVDSKGALYASINLEVVDGWNVTTVSGTTGLQGSKNNVLLNDLKPTSTFAFTLTGKTLYGNGFTIDYNGCATTAGSTYGVITLSSATLDNVRIIGDQWSEYAEKHVSDYRAAAVNATGNSKVVNSYISGCQAALRARTETLLVENTTLEGGRTANLEIMSGKTTIKNLTTVQKKLPVDSPSYLGLGVLISNEAQEGSEIVVEGNLTQYNWVKQTDSQYLPGETSAAASVAFKQTEYVFSDGKEDYVNLGIISMTPNAEITIPENIGYSQKEISLTILGKTVKGAVATLDNTEDDTLLSNGIPSYSGWTATQQGVVKPEGTPVYPNDAYAKNDSGTIKITLEYGKTGDYKFNPSILKLTKYGQPLTVNVYLDDSTEPLTENLTFDQSGTHTLRFEVVDKHNYSPAGIAVTKVYDIFTIPLQVFVNKATALHAQFEYSDGQSGNKITDPSTGKVYISHPTGGTGFGEKTVNGITMYIPVVDVQRVVEKTSAFESNAYFYAPIFSAINIKDYNSGNTDADNPDVTYNSTCESLPINFGYDSSVATPFVSGYNSTKTGSKKHADYGWSYYAYRPTSAEIAQETRDVLYYYTDIAGQKYYYYVRYNFQKYPDDSGSSGGGGCVTPDTLITLADGSQVRVDSLTGNEQLLVWNLKTGKYEAAPIVFVDSEPAEECTVVHLYFSDGSDVKVLYEHGFFDLDLGKYVYIDATNYQDYVGHRFVTEGDISKDTWNIVTLEKVDIETEVTTAWSPVTFEHLCYYTNGVLSMPGGIEGLFNIFEVDTDTMTYDEEQMRKDIETYGLLTFEDFGGMIPQAAFDAFNGQYLNVAIGKNLLTWEQIAALAERYVPLM